MVQIRKLKESEKEVAVRVSAHNIFGYDYNLARPSRSAFLLLPIILVLYIVLSRLLVNNIGWHDDGCLNFGVSGIR